MTGQSNVSSRARSLFATLALGVLAATPVAARSNWTIDPAADNASISRPRRESTAWNSA
jgi:hypothetical protein